jgi:DNA replication protein DnaC
MAAAATDAQDWKKVASFDLWPTGARPLNDHALRVCRRYVEHYDHFEANGGGLGFYGGPGSNKRRLAYALRNELARAHERAKPQVAAWPALVKEERNRMKRGEESVFDTAATCDLLVLTNLGEGPELDNDADPNNPTYWQECLDVLLMRRERAALPTVWFSSLAPSDLRVWFGSGAPAERLWSRLTRNSRATLRLLPASD